MRVGVVTHYMPPHPGGIELVAAALVRGYRAAGHEVRWVASRAPADAPAREDGLVRVACWNAPEERLGTPWPAWGLEGARAVADVVGWADVVHVHDCLYPGSALAAWSCPRRGRPLLLTQHVGFVRYRSAVLNAVQRAAYATLGRFVLRRADRVVPATPSAEAHVAALIGPSPRVVPVPNGIDTERFRPATDAERRAARERLGLAPDATIALFVGRLVEKKGVPAVLALAPLRPRVRFVLVGDGPLAHLLARAPPNVAWLRRVEPEAMPACYHAADVLVLPSHGEGLPLTVQEALSCGIPALVSRGEAFVPPLEAAGACVAREVDAARLADGLDELLADAPARRPAARAHAVRHWSAPAMVASYLALLEELRGVAVGG